MEIDELIAKLEAATEPSWSLSAEIGMAIGWTERDVPDTDETALFDPTGRRRGMLHYTGSLDAALTLVPEGSRWLLDKRPYGSQRNDGYRAEVYLQAHGYLNDRSDVPQHWGPSPALALSIAALKARSAA